MEGKAMRGSKTAHGHSAVVCRLESVGSRFSLTLRCRDQRPQMQSMSYTTTRIPQYDVDHLRML